MQDRFQFSIRSIFLLTALVAVSLAVFLSEPSFASVMARIVVLTPMLSAAIIASIFTRGMTRVFWIGVAVPLLTSAFHAGLFTFQAASVWLNAREVPDQWKSFAQMLNFNAIFLCVAPINGIVCAVAYRLIRPPRTFAILPRPRFVLYAILLIVVAVAFFFGGMVFDRCMAVRNREAARMPPASPTNPAPDFEDYDEEPEDPEEEGPEDEGP